MSYGCPCYESYKWCLYKIRPDGGYDFAFSDQIFLMYDNLRHGKHIDGLVQERRNSSALAMELRLSCTNASICNCIKLYEEWRGIVVVALFTCHTLPKCNLYHSIFSVVTWFPICSVKIITPANVFRNMRCALKFTEISSSFEFWFAQCYQKWPI